MWKYDCICIIWNFKQRTKKNCKQRWQRKKDEIVCRTHKTQISCLMQYHDDEQLKREKEKECVCVCKVERVCG